MKLVLFLIVFLLTLSHCGLRQVHNGGVFCDGTVNATGATVTEIHSKPCERK